MTNKKSEHHNNTVGASIHASAPSRAAANACPPSSNTGGTVDTQKSFVGHVNPNATKVDWLSFTFDQKLDISEYVSGFSALFELNDLDIITDDLGRGQYGYTNTIVFYSRVDKTQTVQIAQLNWGGQTQNNRAYFSINGHGCSTFSYWQEVKSVLESLHDCKITRLDICLDDMTGEDLNMDIAKQAFFDGEFNLTVNHPSHCVMGDWFNPVPVDGRTLQIGKRKNGKMCRIYEKGLQLSHSADSPYHKWVRCEVEIKNTDRVIPFDALTNTDSYFAGSYPFCAKLLAKFNANNPPSTRIEIQTASTQLSVDRLTHYCSTAYGKLISVLQLAGFKPDEIVSSLSRKGVPKRLVAPTLNFSTLGDLDYATRKGNSSRLSGQRIQHRRKADSSQQALLRGAFSRWGEWDVRLLSQPGGCLA
ncbi:MAG: replication initiation factor domain-containing protein [Limnobacter sp.]